MRVECFLDIETIPAQTDAAKARVAAGVKPPATIKKPESVAKWRENDRPKAIDTAIEKTSFNPVYGEVCTIGAAFLDDPAEVLHRYDVTPEGERDVLQRFADMLARNQPTRFIGHFIAGFDLQFITCRCIVRGVTLPPVWPRDPKPWDKQIFDTMTAWAGARSSVSLDDLCFALGIEGKGDFDGSKVAAAWARGDHDTIIEYCADDVHKIRKIYQRFQAVGLA